MGKMMEERNVQLEEDRKKYVSMLAEELKEEIIKNAANDHKRVQIKIDVAKADEARKIR